MVNTLGENSKCTRKQVGAILLRNDRIISTGYNGLPSGSDDTVCKEGCTGCKLTVHAEMNAILFAAKEGVSTQGSDLYVNYSPCLNCAKHIINAGIRAVYFLEMYDKPEGIQALNLLAQYCDVYQLKMGEGEWYEEEITTLMALKTKLRTKATTQAPYPEKATLSEVEIEELATIMANSIWEAIRNE